jgi:hypothetical protein
MEKHTPPTPTHAHAHYHRDVLPHTQRSIVYWHTHEHHHERAERLAEADEQHAGRAHDHAHDRQAMDALPVVRVAA